MLLQFRLDKSLHMLTMSMGSKFGRGIHPQLLRSSVVDKTISQKLAFFACGKCVMPTAMAMQNCRHVFIVYGSLGA